MRVWWVISFNSWREALGQLCQAEGSVQWWIGDALRFGEEKWGEKYQAVIEDSGKEYQTLVNYKWVAGSVDLSRRRDKLAFGHHESVAALSAPQQQKWLAKAETGDGKKPWTVAQLRREIAAASREDTPDLPDGKYRVIYADPPWFYSSMQHSTKEQATTLDTHYKQMPTEEIAALPIREWLPKDAVLFLWTTSPKLYEAEAVIDGWGFQYKASIVWDKVRHNVGYYVSVRHEFLLICTKGSCLPDSKKLEDSVVSVDRGEHSAKPPAFREWIDRMYVPSGRDRVEMFARGALPDHWDGWGDQLGKE